jgi:PAS domain S-box-containing protein
MGYQFDSLCYVRFLSALLAILLVFYLWKRRRARGALYLILFEILAAVWSFSDAMEAASPLLSQKILWSQTGYIGITNCAVMFLMFCMAYTKNITFTRNRYLYLLFVIPVITIILAFTNQLHHLLWSDIVILPGTVRSVYYYGSWFWVNVSFQYSLLCTGIVLLIMGAVRVYTLHRFQMWLLIISVMLPFTASILYVFKVIPGLKGVDLTPVAFIFTGIIIGFSLYRLDFFSIVPIAHRQTIDNLDDGMVILDSMDRVVTVNPAYTRITGIQQNDIMSSHIDSVLSFFHKGLSDFNTENEYRVEAGIEDRFDTKFFEIRMQAVKDSGNHMIGRLVIIRDITLNKMILETLSESNSSRKKEILEKEKLIKDLDAYARMVAHDLKNPLGAISSFTYLIQDALRDNKIGDAAELTEMLQGESNKMVRIIDDLLILSRIRKEEIHIARVDIGAIIAEAVKRLHNLISRKGAIIEIPGEWPEVYGHSQWIEQVWINLISNALKYGGNPPVIAIGCEKEGPTTARFWIKDNGKGLPPEALEKIFNDFERLGASDQEGTGLGLSIVRRIISKMGGTVSVESQNIPGEGCTFSFTLLTVKN